MELEHREQIKSSIPQIVKLLNYEYLRDMCMERGILFDAMVKKLEEKYTTDMMRFEALLNKITLRGPDAYSKFNDILMTASDEITNLTQQHLTTMVKTTKAAAAASTAHSAQKLKQ